MTFLLVCVLLAGYMTLKETLRYLDNLDTSTITFKEFAKTNDDTYPTFSICITDDQKTYNTTNGLMYSYFKTDIEQTLTDSIPDRKYRYFDILPRILRGTKIPIMGRDYKYTGEHLDIQNISIGYFNSLTINLKELVNMVEFMTDNPNDKIEIDETMPSTSQLPFYVSYQDPDTICYSRNNDDKTGIVRVSDTFSFQIKELKRFHDQTMFNFYLHHPGQLLRVFDTPVLSSAVGQIRHSSYSSYSSRLVFKISMVSILRKRKDANIPCNESLHDDDLMLRKEIVSRVGCIPIFWNKIMEPETKLNLCKSPEDMKKINSYLQDLSTIFSSYQPPCNEMKLSFAFDRQKRIGSASSITTTFEYTDKNYQEIINERDFGFESFWSAVGGFVGIFVGASLSQIPIMMTDAWNFLGGLRKSKM